MIDEIGPNVNTSLKVGDNVMAMVVPEGQHGGYASSIVLNQSAVVPTPTSLSRRGLELTDEYSDSSVISRLT